VKRKGRLKTVNGNLGKRQQQVAMAKSMKTNQDIDRIRELGEAAPAATSDLPNSIRRRWRSTCTRARGTLPLREPLP
jgi:hypothetical protein